MEKPVSIVECISITNYHNILYFSFLYQFMSSVNMFAVLHRDGPFWPLRPTCHSFRTLYPKGSRVQQLHLGVPCSILGRGSRIQELRDMTCTSCAACAYTLNFASWTCEFRSACNCTTWDQLQICSAYACLPYLSNKFKQNHILNWLQPSCLRLPRTVQSRIAGGWNWLHRKLICLRLKWCMNANGVWMSTTT